MKIVQYNILDGCREKDRYEKLANWLQKQDYDVAGFNELNEWSEAEFKGEMSKFGLKHTSLLKMQSSRYHIGIASKYPIEFIYATEEKPFHHGLLHVKIQGIHFIVTHLSPFESTIRERETEKIAEYIQSIKEPLLVMGDLNTLSPLDQDFHKERGTKEKMINRKFTNRQHIVDGKINYQPMQTLLDAGLMDVGFRGTFDYSMPTKITSYPKDPIYLRIDYMLANAALMDFKPRAEIIRGADVEAISDHFPIQCKLEI